MRIETVDLKHHAGVSVIRAIDIAGKARMVALQGATLGAAHAHHELIPPFVLPRDLPGGEHQWADIMEALKGDADKE